MKKKFVSYLPARLVQHPSCWRIQFYQVMPDGKRKRFPWTFDINRIKDLTERQAIVDDIIHDLNKVLLPLGFPADIILNKWEHDKLKSNFFKISIPIRSEEENSQLTELRKTPILEALEIAYLKKTRSGKRNTIKSYKTPRNNFTQFLEKHNLSSLPVGKFIPNMASLYTDYLELELGIGECTYNNYIRMLKGMFKHLVSRQFLSVNPFGHIQYKRQKETERRKFEEEDKRSILNYTYNNDLPLFRIIILMYYCGLRVEDCKVLKLKYFKFKTGTITIPGQLYKNGKTEIKTIPKKLYPYLTEGEFINNPGSYYVFGKGLKPGPKPCAINLPYNRHRQALETLFEKEIIKDIESLTLYSWRNTTATDHLEEILNPLRVKDMMGHSKLETTLKYRRKKIINKEFRELECKLLDCLK